MGLISLVLFGILGLGLLAVFNLNQKAQDLASKAAPATTVTATTANTNVTVGQTFSVEIQVNTGANVVKAIDFDLEYDPAYLQLTEITKGTWMTNANQAVKNISQATGKTYFGLVIPPTASPAFVTGNGTAAVATFVALKASPTVNINFNTARSVAGASNERQNVITSYNALTLAIADSTVIPPNSDNFIVYSYEACFSQNSDGHSTYILWKPTVYADVVSIDVSEKSDFTESSTKTVAGTTSTLTFGYLLTDGTNFRQSGQANGVLRSFKPDVSYYFRLNYGSGLKSAVVVYKPASCAGQGGTAIKQCNEACENTSECLTNLTCQDKKCRRIGNEGDDKCVLPPDKGIHRGCNEYCSNDGECGDGYKCWWNQCRNPRDLANANCKVPLKPGEVEGCNLYCANDGECASGLKCWWNQCRLPKNTDSTTCQLKPTAAPAPKGGGATTVKPKPTKVPTAAPKTTPKATVSAKVKIDSLPTPTFIKSLKTSPAVTQPSAQPTKAAAKTSSLASNFLSLIPTLLVIIFVGLLGLLFGPQALRAINQKNNPPRPPTA